MEFRYEYSEGSNDEQIYGDTSLTTSVEYLKLYSHEQL